MAKNEAFQRYLDAGIAFTNLTRARAEELVNELIRDGELQGKEARAWVDEVLARSKTNRQGLMDHVRSEVTRQLDSLGITDVDDLAAKVGALLDRTAEAGRTAASRTAASAKKATGRGTAKKTAAKKTAAKKTAAKKTAAKKTAAKKSGTKESAAKKTAAKKSAARRPGTRSAG